MSDLLIDAYIDVTCPWCRMGTTSMLSALKQLPPETKVSVRWHAFQINYGIRPEGEDYRQVMIDKLGGASQFEARLKQYQEYGDAYGLTYNMDRVKYTPNTTLAHQLIAITPDNLQEQLIQRIYTAYFENGINIGDIDELIHIANAVGLSNVAELKKRLTYGEGLDNVELDQKNAQKQGIRGVPYFVINEQVSLSGLQPPEQFIKVWRELA
ncbi:hypothetical protein PAECIP111891_06223 [Paenibacillus allorhizoplanae]|uniref:DSBA-like thioredoxin domain-containing protein n=1 Tax=Paenibacillus allorhizoplanae TaxID=2905648 RepID=A0ABM9CZD8_9BACL|nr:DsbA family oxidoreductase [Paenibacillus allorhizoplanae]CAH1227990.1 hypothetical protein PAECIP111891_06223 [Paenibacillus allorhizoplanae]